MASTIKALSNEQAFIDKINSSQKYRERIEMLFGLGDDPICHAAKSTHTYMSEPWILLSGKKQKKEVPKSDVILQLKSGKLVGVSIKSGAARPTSADCNETVAILKSVLESNEFKNNTELKSSVNELCRKLKETNKKVLTENHIKTNELKKGNLQHEDLQELINLCPKYNKMIIDINLRFPDYLIGVICECYSGKNKFGNSLASPKFILEFKHSENVEKIGKIINVNDIQQLANYSEKYLFNRNSFFGMKNGGSTPKGRKHWIRFL